MSWISDYQRWLSESESMQNAQEIVNYFKGSDWSKEALSAMIGNMRHESSINPDMYEFGYAWSADRGYGLVQWTPRSKYWDWAVSRNLPPRDGNSQLARIDYEVENNIQWIPRSDYGGMTFAQFRQNTGNWSVDYLTEAFTWGYERPNQQAGESSMPARKAFANRAFNELNWDGTGGGGGKPAWPTTEGLPITSTYGWRDFNGGSYHWAIDIGGGGQTHPIYATQSGVVYRNVWSDSGGWMVYIQHTGDPYFSRYIHLDVQSPIAVGTSVTKGQEIGTMGNTGISFGIHLDFAIAINADGWGVEATTIDPELYLQMDFGGGVDPPNPSPTGGMKPIIHMLLANALNGWGR